MSRKLNVVPFALFVRRQQVLCMYRTFYRTARRISDKDLQISILDQIRTSFKTNAQITDNSTVKACIAEGKRSLQQLESIVETAGVSEKEKYVVGNDWPWGR